MSDEMAQRAEYEWRRAEDAETELRERNAEIERLKAVADAADAHLQARWHVIGTGSAKMADRVSGDDIAAAAKAECEAFQHLNTALTQWKEAQS